MIDKDLTPTEYRDEMLDTMQSTVLEPLVDELRELDNVAQIWVRPERTYTKIYIAMREEDKALRDKIYDVELEYSLASDCILNFRVFDNPHNIESDWRYKVLYDETDRQEDEYNPFHDPAAIYRMWFG